MGSWRDHIPAGAWPRLMPAPMAAAYLGQSVNTFYARVRAGRYPRAAESDPPKWDRFALDRAVDGSMDPAEADGFKGGVTADDVDPFMEALKSEGRMGERKHGPEAAR